MYDKATLRFIQEHCDDDVRKLALQAARYPGVNIPAALTQIEGRQTARIKLPTWAAIEGVIYPPRLSMEQCSSETTAQYKASLIHGDTFADLTGGFGIDCSYISHSFSQSLYIERNETLCNIARHNFHHLGLNNINIICGDSCDILDTLPHCNWIFADPARRDGCGKKVVALSDCEPDITLIEEKLMSKCDNAMIKCSPMADITAICRQVRHISDIHIVAVNNECKELLLILSNEKRSGNIKTVCVNITKEGMQTMQYITESEEQSTAIRYAAEMGRYLYEPNAAIQKAGCHTQLSARYSVEKLHPNSQLYTSNSLINDFPGRIFEIETTGGFAKNEIKSLLGNITKANLTVRNFPQTVEQLRKRLKIAEGGEVYLFATTLSDGKKVIIRCHKASLK